MRQYSGFGTAEESNQRYRFLLEQGQTGLSVAFDLPTQCGYDPIDPIAAQEVGKVGVSVSNLREMEILFQGIDLSRISVSFTINGTAAIIYAMYLAAADKAGVPRRQLTGTIQNDILKEYVARGTWIFPVRPSMRLIADSILFANEQTPRFNPISIAGAHMRDAGCTAVEEVAYTLANALAYVDELRGRGAEVDGFAGRLSFFFYVHTDFFEEVCKFRAARRIWARLMKERYGAKDPKSWLFRFGVVCGGASLTAAQPYNNVARVTIERWLRFWAEHSRSSPPRWTRLTRFRPSRPRRSRCVRSRSSLMRAGSRIASTLWEAAITSSTSPIVRRRRFSR